MLHLVATASMRVKAVWPGCDPPSPTRDLEPTFRHGQYPPGKLRQCQVRHWFVAQAAGEAAERHQPLVRLRRAHHVALCASPDLGCWGAGSRGSSLRKTFQPTSLVAVAATVRAIEAARS